MPSARKATLRLRRRGLDSAPRLGTPTERRAVPAFVAAVVLRRPSPPRFARHPPPQAPPLL